MLVVDINIELLPDSLTLLARLFILDVTVEGEIVVVVGKLVLVVVVVGGGVDCGFVAFT